MLVGVIQVEPRLGSPPRRVLLILLLQHSLSRAHVQSNTGDVFGTAADPEPHSAERDGVRSFEALSRAITVGYGASCAAAFCRCGRPSRCPCRCSSSTQHMPPTLAHAVASLSHLRFRYCSGFVRHSCSTFWLYSPHGAHHVACGATARSRHWGRPHPDANRRFGHGRG